MAEKDPRDAGSAWPALALMITLLGGLYYYRASLSSSRPRDAGQHPDTILADQNIDARLWQDPFAAVARAPHADLPTPSRLDRFLEAVLVRVSPTTRPVEGALAGRLALSPDQEDLPTRLRECTRRGKSVLLLPVLVDGLQYPDSVELRLRIRQAVLHGLGVAGYIPDDPAHIGCLSLNWPRFPGPCSLRSSFTSSAGHVDIPYEWCRPRLSTSVGTPHAGPTYDRILVLWIREELLQQYPLRRLAQILCAVGAGDSAQARNPQAVRIIGPVSSTTLRQFAVEVRTHPLDQNTRDVLHNARMFSAMPTASEKLLLEGLPDGPQSPGGSAAPAACIADVIAAGVSRDFRLVRATATDDQLADELCAELERRHINVASESTHIALVSEWDTFYGRSLPLTFYSRATSQPSAELPPPPGQARIRMYTYFRGLDGLAPSATPRGAAESPPGEPPLPLTRSTRPGEDPDGPAQVDYLRRLADDLAREHARLSNENGRGLQAVGVLGSDLYDKLLVLRALRPRLPGVVFFTTDLDARLALPQERDAALNLVVASAYGLRLNPAYQQGAPPFRDTYQTATFAATLMACDRLAPPPETELAPPRLFEIGRSGPHDLSMSGYTDQELLARHSLHPQRPQVAGWWTLRHGIIFVFVLALALLYVQFRRFRFYSCPSCSQDDERSEESCEHDHRPTTDRASDPRVRREARSKPVPCPFARTAA